MNFLKNTLFAALCCTSVMTFAMSDPNDLVGHWRNIDDKTGFSKGIVEIKKDSNGIYTGKIIEILPRPNYIPKTHCQNCPPPYTNQLILGLQVLNGMRQSEDNPREFVGGTILDPLNGKIYKSKIKLNSTGSRIVLRGFVGFETFGRSQTWMRHK